MFNNTTKTQWGDIETRPAKRGGGIELLAYNHERGRRVSVGTVRGDVFEKGNAAILRKPEPSFCLSRSELNAAKEAGANFIRLITPEKTTYAIELERFEANAEKYFNAYYGDQLRCSLRFFAFIASAKPRSERADNPAMPAHGKDVIEQRREIQLALFGARN